MPRYILVTDDMKDVHYVFDKLHQKLVTGRYMNKYMAQTECDRLNVLWEGEL